MGDTEDDLNLDSTDNLDTGADTGGDTGQPEAPESKDKGGQPEKPSKPESVRQSIARSLKEIRAKPDDKTDDKAKPPDKGAAAPGPKAGDKDSTTTPPQAGGMQPTSGVPDAWKSKELAPVWQSLTPAVQAAIAKRETDMQKGVEQLKTRHQDIENVIAPNRERIRQFGFTEPQAIDQMFKWQAALAGPQKLQAFVSLMQSHGVDPATFAAAILQASGGAAPSPAPQPNGQGNGQLDPRIQAEIDGLKQKLGMFEGHISTQMKSAAEQTVMGWAKDKPHYDKVRTLMAQLIQAGTVKASANDPHALDAAYEMAIHAHPETRAVVAQEQREKEIAARKATAEKARKAGSSMRTGAPVPPTSGGGPPRDVRNETVRDSIQRALATLRTQ